MEESYITLRQAMESGLLPDFVAQEEARGIGPVASKELDTALSRLIKAGKSADRTSRSSLPGDSTGTKTR
jgi:hypothetical protein